MTRGIHVRLAAVPLIVLTFATAGVPVDATARPGGIADCAAFGIVYHSELAPLSGRITTGDQAVSVLTDLANALTAGDTSSRTVRQAARRVVADIERYDATAAERDVAQLDSLARTLLAECGSAADVRTA